ncbi:MAG: GGDEF domain-containing protein [Terracidiphilus sp.]
MYKLTPALPPTEPDTGLLDRLALLERVTLAAAILLFALNLAAGLVVLLGWNFPGDQHLMNAETALAALCCALSLRYSSPQYSKRNHRLALLLAAAAAAACTAIVCEYVFPGSHVSTVPVAAVHGFRSSFPARMPLTTAGGFAFLALALTTMRVQKRAAVMTADFLTFCLVLLVLILVSGHVIAVLGIFGPSESAGTSSLSMLGLLLLTMVAFFRRAENGVFAILLGRGIGSNIARGLTPLLFVLPYLRECARARFINFARMPSHYTTALLASLAVMLSFALLLFLAWRINCMEVEIHDLSLRDALTDLYNLRGFHLLADQALRMARRSHLPFSVLYIDLNDLKRTNDSLGHKAGSELLMETGRILKSSFRETDVVGRIGGDEFAVAGQFSPSGICMAAQRIEESAARRNAEDGCSTALSFSLGYVTTGSGPNETLDELLAKADQAMYVDKRRKKVAVS